MSNSWSKVARAARAKRRVTTIVVLVVIGAGVFAGLELTGSSEPAYRTVAASFGDVQQTTALTGTIEPVTQADLNFSTSGTVMTVGVTLGDKVNEGSVLATLETESLSAQVDQARAMLDTAETTLKTDESPSASMLTTDESTVSGDRSALSDDETAMGDASATNQMSLTQAQDAVIAAQSSLSMASLQLENDQSSLDAAKAKESVDCQGDALAGSQVCAGDETAVASDQSRVAGDESAVTGDQSQLSTAEDNVASTQLSNSQALAQDTQKIAIDRSQLSTAEADLTTARKGASPDQLASDEASVASAVSSLQTARQSLAGATLISPISGTVVAVSVVPGGTANAAPSSVGSPSSSGSGSSGSAIEVESPGTFEVQATATDAQVSAMKVGDKAIITPSGSYVPIVGSVTQVGTFASVSSSGVVTFPVTIGVKGAPKGLYEGVSAQLSVVLIEVQHVLSVPSSAVHTFGLSHFVYLLEDGKQVMDKVTVGAVGGQLTQITAGLSAGEMVVLANLSAGVPSPTSNGNGFNTCTNCTRIIGPGGGVVNIQGNTGPKGG